MFDGRIEINRGRAASTASCLHVIESHDVDEQAALLRGWNQTYTQMSPGAFTGSIAEVACSGARLFLEETNNALYQVGELPRGLLAVGIPVNRPGLATFCGAPCEDVAVHVFSGSNGFEFQTPSGLIMAGIVIDADELSSVLAFDELEKVLPSLAYAHLRRVADDDAHCLRQLFTGVFEIFRFQPHLADNAALLQALKQSLLSNMAHALVGNRMMDEPLISPGRRWRIVASARELVTERPDSPITVAELCVTLRISRRSLQYCFQDVLGLGPAEFLRNVRLDGARRAIKSAQSVTEAATLWGFWHFGRFAQDYRAMFGELPSEAFSRYHA
jgi:AraC family transcriptional regulator, ethanolamine operon transcriptional activator